MASARTANFASSAAKLSTNSSISRVGAAVARSNSPGGTLGANVSQLGRSSATKTVQTANFNGALGGVKKFDAASKFALDKKFAPIKPGNFDHQKFPAKGFVKYHGTFDKFHHYKDWWWGNYCKWPSYNYGWPNYGCYYPSYGCYYPSYGYCYPSYGYCYPSYGYCYPSYNYCYPSYGYCYPICYYPQFTYGTASYGIPSYDTPGYGTASYDTPSYGTPDVDFGLPSAETPAGDRGPVENVAAAE
jgi:hypothetical protein